MLRVRFGSNVWVRRVQRVFMERQRRNVWLRVGQYHYDHNDGGSHVQRDSMLRVRFGPNVWVRRVQRVFVERQRRNVWLLVGQYHHDHNDSGSPDPVSNSADAPADTGANDCRGHDDDHDDSVYPSNHGAHAGTNGHVL
tara:strand:+ start:168 stop:584 length:417 start_codon:yes stop_codon:yes gene_type:complete